MCFYSYVYKSKTTCYRYILYRYTSTYVFESTAYAIQNEIQATGLGIVAQVRHITRMTRVAPQHMSHRYFRPAKRKCSGSETASGNRDFMHYRQKPVPIPAESG